MTALAVRPSDSHFLLTITSDLVSGITIALSLGAPLLAASIVVEIAGALIARSAAPAHVHALLSPLRALGILAVAAIAFDRIGAFMSTTLYSGMR